jgi:hypothetical protein
MPDDGPGGPKHVAYIRYQKIKGVLDGIIPAILI